MMMAHDSSPGDGSLDDETVAVLRSALVAYIDAPAHGERLRESLRSIAGEARRKAILPEHLLIVLKDVWFSLPAARTLDEPDDQVRLLQRVVTMCIKEYYAD